MNFEKLYSKKSLFLALLFYSFKFFGVATATINKSLAKDSIKKCYFFVNSIKGKLYNTFLFFCLTVLNFFSISYLYDTIFKIQSLNLETIVNCGQDFFNYFTAICILTTFSINQDEFVKIANKLVMIEKSVRLVGKSTQREETIILKSLTKTLIVTSVIWSSVITTHPFISLSFYLSCFVLYLNQFIIHAVVIQYISVLKLIKGLFVIINKNLVEISKKPSAVCEDVFITRSNYSKRRIDRLIHLHKTYSSLCEACQELSGFYSQPMLFCVSAFFLSITNIAYNLAKLLVLKKQSFCSNNYFHYCLYELLNSVMIVMMTKSVTGTIQEVHFIEWLD